MGNLGWMFVSIVFLIYYSVDLGRLNIVIEE
jgi:hypothetical protein